MNKKIKIISYILLLLLIISSLILWITGVFDIWFTGLPAIYGNINSFTDSQGQYIKGEYTVTINLDDLQSNIGKKLYDDKRCRIYVDSIYNDQYQGEITFKTSGKVSLTGATLVSGMHHYYSVEPGKQGFTADFTAQMSVEYKGKEYQCEVAGSGPVYYYGDEFCFYLPAELYNSGELPGGTIQLTVKNLYENIWTIK